MWDRFALEDAPLDEVEVFVEHRDSEALQAALRELIESEELREQLGSTAKQMAIELHDGRNVSEKLKGIIQGAIMNFTTR